ncbi:MAG: TraR/DksA C4-type zinc finger protein [Candidatus Paceibacterota bacterium]|jgi:RNA polymerase-binding transcription factor DksA
MTPEFINQKKEELLKKKRDLESELNSFAVKTGDSDWKTKYPQMNNDEEEKTDEVEEYENLLPVEKALEEKIRDINVALEKIDNGEYGKCSFCGKTISEERLNVLPEAKTCDICKCKNSECINN